MLLHRRECLRAGALALLAGPALAAEAKPPLKITSLKVTPIALPDPPILAASGCHGPYFLRNVVEIGTDAGIVGIAETVGGEGVTRALERARDVVVGRDAFAYRGFAQELLALSPAVYAGVETACLDAAGKATGRRLCDLLGGPVRPSAEFSAYLFYRYASDHPTVLADPHLVDPRRKAGAVLDEWGEVRSPAAMAEMAAKFRDRWGFRTFKLKGGVLRPVEELETMKALSGRLGPDALLRIDPNARWTTPTAMLIGHELKRLNLEYYEDPVAGQRAMADVRIETKLKMSTNMCVTRFADLKEALQIRPIDVLLGDLHYFGGFAGNLALGPVCDAAGWTMSQHSNSHAGLTMAAMIHLGVACPQLTLASDTHYPWLVDDADILEGPKLPIHGGRMEIPVGPGLGVALDRDKLARAHEVYDKCGVRRRDDGALMRRLDPGWTGEKM